MAKNPIQAWNKATSSEAMDYILAEMRPYFQAVIQELAKKTSLHELMPLMESLAGKANKKDVVLDLNPIVVRLGAKLDKADSIRDLNPIIDRLIPKQDRVEAIRDLNLVIQSLAHKVSENDFFEAAAACSDKIDGLKAAVSLLSDLTVSPEQSALVKAKLR